MTNVEFDLNMYTADAIDNVGHACTTWIIITNEDIVSATANGQVKMRIARKGNFAWQLADILSQ